MALPGWAKDVIVLLALPFWIFFSAIYLFWIFPVGLIASFAIGIYLSGWSRGRSARYLIMFLVPPLALVTWAWFSPSARDAAYGNLPATLGAINLAVIVLTGALWRLLERKAD